MENNECLNPRGLRGSGDWYYLQLSSTAME